MLPDARMPGSPPFKLPIGYYYPQMRSQDLSSFLKVVMLYVRYTCYAVSYIYTIRVLLRRRRE